MAFILQVDSKEQAEVYNIYLRKAAEIYGVTRTRQIYETAIETLKESESRDMCIRFSHAVVVTFTHLDLTINGWCWKASNPICNLKAFSLQKYLTNL